MRQDGCREYWQRQWYLVPQAAYWQIQRKAQKVQKKMSPRTAGRGMPWTQRMSGSIFRMGIPQTEQLQRTNGGSITAGQGNTAQMPRIPVFTMTRIGRLMQVPSIHWMEP